MPNGIEQPEPPPAGPHEFNVYRDDRGAFTVSGDIVTSGPRPLFALKVTGVGKSKPAEPKGQLTYRNVLEWQIKLLDDGYTIEPCTG